MKYFYYALILSLTFTATLALTFDDEPSPIVFNEPETLVEYPKDEIHCLALNIYHESRNDNLAGKTAVADVVINRVLDRRYPNTICDVVYQGKRSKWWAERGEDVPVKNMCQFSWFCDGESDEPRLGKSWDEARLIAKNILTHGEYRGITEGATHYHATYVSPKWATAKGMHMIGQIGEHIFYRWK